MTFEDLKKAAKAHGDAEWARAIDQGYGPDQSGLIANAEERIYMSRWLWQQLAALDASSSAAEVARAVALYPHIIETATGSDRDGCERALVEAMARVQGVAPDFGDLEVCA